MPRKKKKIKSKAKPKPRAVNFLAPEFVYYKKSVAWYFAFGTVGLGLVAVAVWQSQWFLAVVLFLALVVFFQYSKKRPKSKKCHVGKDGIKVDERIFPLSWFKSFSIIYDEPVSHLFLETVRRFYPSFWLHIKNKDLKRVRNALLRILPERSAQESVIVKINRWIRF